MSSVPSSQTKRDDRRTEEPCQSQLQRIDVPLSDCHWAMLDAIRDCGHSKREAVEMALEVLIFIKIVQGEIPRSVQAEILRPWPWAQGS